MALTEPGVSLDPTHAATVYSGVELIVRLPELQQAIDRAAGLRTSCVVSGYPGSPLGGVDLALARRRADGIEHVPGVNEELAAAVVWGSQQRNLMDLGPDEGVIGMWYGKSPGIDRSGDVLKHANSMGTAPNGGVLVVVGDDPAAKSSSIPNDSRGAFFDAQMPVLVPASSADLVDLGLHGFALSRFSGLWVGLKVVTDFADGFAALDLEQLLPDPVLPEVRVEGRRWHHTQIPTVNNTVSVQQEHDILVGRLEAARAYALANGLNRVTHGCEDAWLGLVAAGKSHADLLQALEWLGLGPDSLADAGIRVLKIGMPYPLEPTAVRAFARGLEQILVIEEKRPFLELFVRDVLYGEPHHPPVTGKRATDGSMVVPAEGDLTADRLVEVLREQLASRLGSRLTAPRPQSARGGGTRIADAPVSLPVSVVAGGAGQAVSARRVPAFCSGCPHNRSTASLPGAIVGGGVGCHSIVYLEDRHADDVILPLTPMGAEGVPWVGAAKFARAEHIFQNLGDGTYAHSGSLAIRACVAAGVNITFKLLYNGAIAMTGAQDVAGGTEVPEMTRELEALGVRRIIVCAADPHRHGRDARFAAGSSVWPRERFAEAEATLAREPGVTALIFDQRCAAEARRLWKRGTLPEPRTRAVINEAVCEGCGDCQRKSNCLSVIPVSTPLGRKTQVHQSSCNHDLTCVEGDCPAFLTVIEPASKTQGEGDKRDARRHSAPPVPAVPAPPTAESRDTLSVYMVGIGGTGVVTASRIVATAATIDGWTVAGLDQTGLSQKAGAVSSHLRASRGRQPLSNSIGEAGCDLLLAFDPLAAAEPRHLSRLDRERSHAVIASTVTPTVSVITQPHAEMLSFDSLRERIAAATRSVISCDAQTLSERLFDDHLPANILMVGVSVQAGLLPLSVGAIEAAIGELGAATEVNLAAFRWGRAIQHDPSLAARGGRPVEATPSVPAQRRSSLRRVNRLLATHSLPAPIGAAARWRGADLIEYQGTALAARYLEVVSCVAAAEQAAAPESTALGEAVATYLYKLMAYKDEYEVARLHLQEQFRGWVRGQHPRAKVRYMLQPPVLRTLGMKRKLAVPPAIALPAFTALRGTRRVRGSRLDPFGRAEVRRVERQLVEEYIAIVERLARTVSAENLAAAVSIASLPDLVRGYEAVKLHNVNLYRARLATALNYLDSPPDVRSAGG